LPMKHAESRVEDEGPWQEKIGMLHAADQSIRRTLSKELEKPADARDERYIGFLSEEMLRRDDEAFETLKSLPPDEALLLPEAAKQTLTVMIAHWVSGPLDAPERGMKRFDALLPLIQALWDLRIDFGKGHFGRNLLNRLSAIAFYRTSASTFLNFEDQSLDGEDFDYFLGSDPGIPQKQEVGASLPGQ
jgi:hypothetical protein